MTTRAKRDPKGVLQITEDGAGGTRNYEVRLNLMTGNPVEVDIDEKGTEIGILTPDEVLGRYGKKPSSVSAHSADGVPFPEGLRRIIDMLTMHPEERRRVVWLLGEISANAD